MPSRSNRLSNKLKKQNLVIFKNLMNYKHKMSISDRWWGNKAKELKDIINEIPTENKLRENEIRTKIINFFNMVHLSLYYKKNLL